MVGAVIVGGEGRAEDRLRDGRRVAGQARQAGQGGQQEQGGGDHRGNWIAGQAE